MNVLDKAKNKNLDNLSDTELFKLLDKQQKKYCYMKLGRYHKNLFKANYKILSVRGPLTYNFLKSWGYNNIPRIFGDPGLLISKYYKPNIIMILPTTLASYVSLHKYYRLEFQGPKF